MSLLRMQQVFSFCLILVTIAGGNEFGWYQSFLNERIAPVYAESYRTLKNKIMNPILAFKNEELSQNGTNDTAIIFLVERLTCATKNLYDQLSTALNASEKLNSDVEQKSSEIKSAISQKENEVQEASNQLASIEVQLNRAHASVQEAENEVRNKDNELRNADSRLADEQRKLDEARLCGLRKKRFIKKLIRPIVRPIVHPFVPILKPILKPACAVLNYGGINSAKDARAGAQGAVNAAREQLANRQRELENHRSTQVNFRNQKSLATAQLQTFRNSLGQLQSRHSALASMTTDLRKVIIHLATYVSRSNYLYKELLQLVNFEALIEPLNRILTELIENGMTTRAIVGVTQISSAEVEWAVNIIKNLQSQLPSQLVIKDDSTIC